MHRHMRRLREERGQAIILFVGIFTVIMVISAIVVDFGLWFSERRGAQKDADATALAGVQAYLADLADTSGAFDDAQDWAVKNGVDPAEIDIVSTSDCSAGNSCIEVGIGGCREDGTDASMPWVQANIRHKSRSLFSSLFGLVAPDIGGVARACVGSPRTATDLSPFGVQMAFDPDTGEPLSDCLEQDPINPSRTRPVYGAVCILKTGAGDSVSGQRGQLTIGNLACDQTSSNTLRHDFHYGTNAGCTIDQEVNTGTGNIIGLLQGKAQVEAAHQAVRLAQQTLDAEQKKLQAGVSTPYQTVLRQRDLITAETAEVQAVTNYARALVEMDRAMGTTMNRNGIEIGDAFSGTISRMPTPPFSVRGFTPGGESR